jgi:hypothetical protein
MPITVPPSIVYRRYETDGVPESGNHQPEKAEIIQLLDEMVEDTASARSVADQALEGQRERLTGARTYYIRLDGNDANDGLTNNSAGAFRTLQAAYNFVCDHVDLAGYTVKFKIGDGAYEGFATNRMPVGAQGCASVVIEGNLANPANVVFTPASGIPIDIGAANGFGSLVKMTLAGFKVQSTSIGMRILGGGTTVLLDRVNFGSCGLMQIYVGHDAFVYCSTDGITISGNAERHAFVYTKATYVQESIPVTFLNSPSFVYAYIAATQGALVLVGGATFVNKGSVTGPRYNITSFAHIDTQNGGGDPSTFLPGTVAGFASAQGLID